MAVRNADRHRWNKADDRLVWSYPQEAVMPYCTIVEFEWDESFDHEGFASMLDRMSEGSPPPEGRLSRIAGIDGQGARMIEVWRSSDDAQAFARRSAPLLSTAQMPAPSRVVGFEVTDYVIA
jgi:hypothetical protein